MEITLPFNYTPRDYQLPAWLYLQEATKRSHERGYRGIGARACCVWHRRAGKDLSMVHFASTQSQKRVGHYWHVLPTQRMGRQIVWEGKTRDGTPFLDAFPEAMVARRRDDEMRMWFQNGSSFQVIGADDPDRLVGANPVGVVFSEWSLMHAMAWELIRPILSENGGWAIFIFTPRGRNHGWRTLQEARANPEVWFNQILTADDTHAIDAEALRVEEKSMAPELYRQEFFCSFDAPLAGSYYGDLMTAIEQEERITSVPWIPDKPVWSSWDLGVADSTAIWFGQHHGAQFNWIDYDEASGQGLDHYARLVTNKPYTYQRHILPHDAAVRELGKHGAKSRVKTLQELGIRGTVLPNRKLQDGIDAMRMLLPRSTFDAVKCERGIQALKEYTRAEMPGVYDPDGKPVYAQQPKHTWASNGADSARYMALGLRPEQQKHEGRLIVPSAIV